MYFVYFRLRLLQQQVWFQLIAVGVTPNPSASFGINMFWRRNCNIQSFQLSEMGLANVDSNTSDTGEILSGSYPLLNKNNIIWSNFVILADGSRFQVNLRPTLQISFFSKCYQVLHMYADLIRQ